MIVSLFTALVARGAELPVIDPRLTQLDPSRVDTQDQGSAATPEQEPAALASVGNSTGVDGTQGDE